MANRRMFSKEIIDSDMFLEMPLSTQALYFHLAMRADDDGFVNNPKKISRMVGSNDDDAKILLTKKFILSFESGVIVIKHWKLHNYIQKDRYKKTNYSDEMRKLGVKDNGVYTMDTECIQDVRVGKVSLEIGKVSLKKDNIPFSEIVNYLNQKANTKYRANGAKTKDLIKARFNEGFNLEDFKTVIDKKCANWLDDSKMSIYLRPETLFSNKFEGYLNEVAAKSKLNIQDIIYTEEEF